MPTPTRCPGTGQPVRNQRNLSDLGSKFWGKSAGDCAVCGRSVITRKGTAVANPHAPREA